VKEAAPARLCHASGVELEQFQFVLGYVSVQTTERYLDCEQRIRSAVNDSPGELLSRALTRFEPFIITARIMAVNAVMTPAVFLRLVTGYSYCRNLTAPTPPLC
jgi:hypothetical protein